jgi:anti-sigma B factor antagonist
VNEAQHTARVAVDVHDGHTAVVLTGELDQLGCGDIRDALRQAVESGGRLEVHLGALTFIDSSGLGLLVELNRRCAEHGGQMMLDEVPPGLLSRFQLTGLDQYFTFA